MVAGLHGLHRRWSWAMVILLLWANPLPAQYDQSGASAQGSPSIDRSGTWSPGQWAQAPSVRATPRMGWFLLPASGPGYYSLWDCLHNDVKDKAPPNRYGNPFYENDFRFLDQPKPTAPDWGNCFKRLHAGSDWMVTFGGEERLRFANEVSSRLSTADNQFQLIRSRVYGDAWFQDRLRLFAEFFHADSFNENLRPLSTDEDHGDFFDLFVDVKVADLPHGPVYFRGGQQQLLYGSQRLIAPPDWSNTRRTFRGVKGFYRGEAWDVDVFWARPVIPDRTQFNDTDNDQDFAGLWLTHRPTKGQTIDFYYLFREQRSPLVTGFNKVKGDQETNTLGCRYAGDKNHWLWDVEIMGQWGQFANQDMTALAVTCGLGYSFAELPLEPTLWIYNDFASGTDNPTGTHRHTFNQLFPSGHSYFGYLDQVGRQNIDDVNLQFSIRPAKWNLTLLQAHFFYLDSARDALYNTQSAAVRRDPSGKSGHHVGNEIDLLTTFRLSAHHEFNVGFSKLFAGEFLRRTGPAVSPELFYFQYYFRW